MECDVLVSSCSLVPFLFHNLQQPSLHHPSFRRNVFSTCFDIFLVDIFLHPGIGSAKDAVMCYTIAPNAWDLTCFLL